MVESNRSYQGGKPSRSPELAGQPTQLKSSGASERLRLKHNVEERRRRDLALASRLHTHICVHTKIELTNLKDYIKCLQQLNLLSERYRKYNNDYIGIPV